ncbi:MAG: hypothetical protein NWE89_04990 [Candidatus Bathyarchaeota archaeon]|nr:hypothetical protein [Candidatus Bathyarchaeota archaeon]
MAMAQTYHYGRYSWWRDVDIDKLAKELSEDYEVTSFKTPGESQYEISIYMNTRREILVKSDTVGVFISRFKALLFQKETKPFTKKDLKLRKKILEVYRRDRPSPFPWLFSDESPYTVAEEQ